MSTQPNVRAAVAVAAMIANPSDAELRQRAIEALADADDADYEATMTAFEATYGPKAAALRVPMAAMRRSRRK